MIDIIIPSHKRAGEVTANKHVVGAKICVPESQLNSYLQFHDRDELITHPDNIVGLMAKRQWIYERHPNVFMIDDDAEGMFRTYDTHRKNRVSPERATEIINQSAIAAKEMGAFMFGYNTSGRWGNPWRPFRLGGFSLGGATGYLEGSKLFWPDSTLICCDLWMAALNAHFHRYLFIDLRFSWHMTPWFTGQLGGQAEYRVDGWGESVFQFMRRHFGEAIQRPGKRDSFGQKYADQGRANEVLNIPYKV